MSFLHGTTIIDSEKGGQIPFLVDTLATRRNGVITIDVYRKSHRPIFGHSFTPRKDEKKHKKGNASSLLNRASNLLSTREGNAKYFFFYSQALYREHSPFTTICLIKLI